MKRFWIAVCAIILCVATVGCGNKASLPSDFSIGTFNGQVYENTFIGLGCNLPADFTYTSAEELDDLNQLLPEMTDAERNEAYANANTLYLMQANNTEGGGIGINLENTAAEGAQVTSAKQYLSTAKSELPSAMEQMGFTEVTVSEKTFSFAGKDRTGLQVKGNIYEDVFFQNYLCFEADQYLVIISYGAYGEEIVNALTDSFYAV